MALAWKMRVFVGSDVMSSSRLGFYVVVQYAGWLIGLLFESEYFGMCILRSFV